MNRVYLIAIMTFVFLSQSVYAQLVWFGKTMSVTDAQKRWGLENFDADKFKNGSRPTRAKMAVSIVKNKKTWIGKSFPAIKKELGEHDGFYFTDWIPAYFITDAEKKGDEAWQVVFLPGNDRKVKDIIIELNGSR